MLRKLMILCLLPALMASLTVATPEPVAAQHMTPTAEPTRSGFEKNEGKPKKPKPKPGPREEGEDN